MDIEEKNVKAARPRGRPATKGIASTARKTLSEPANQPVDQERVRVGEEEVGSVITPVDASLEDEGVFQQSRQAGAFGMLLRHLLNNERSEIIRLTTEIGVSDNTIYRWLNGICITRPGHLKRLLEALPQPSA